MGCRLEDRRGPEHRDGPGLGFAVAPRRPPSPLAEPAPAPALASPEALRVFRALIADWRVPPARAWRMLTGVGYQAGSLTPDQVQRVEILAMVDQAMQGTVVGSVGEWMEKPNTAPIFAGSAPMDYLARLGQPGYEALLRQVVRWRGL